ncbi:DUF951 domain-containing protein [Candidatus Desulforudis audaxviator]|uniref:DUF951 domain-containing protein n=1 Tax=Desulforudis audaxviator (strain MP104C) TaxID=477974 RepID=B1I6T4_DESAP|nr:protein of unknown function DUF951 [Candidatus Desulforudis audaxviator MP104C]AZK60792.1 hypothetical protein Daudx_2264 [Candidatus Desulforudis audaxviator]
MIPKFEVGDVVEMKKRHPCGGWEWEVLRTGVDFRLRCRTCGRVILLPRPQFLKGVKRIVGAPGKGDGLLS